MFSPAIAQNLLGNEKQPEYIDMSFIMGNGHQAYDLFLVLRKLAKKSR